MEQRIDTQLIRKYLVGALGGKRRAQIEMRLLSDAEFREEVAIVQSELIDDYVAGGLEGEELDGFERHLRSAPERLQKVRFAKALGAYADSATARAAPAREVSFDSGRRERFFARVRGLSVLVPLAAAALVIVTAGVLYWAYVSNRTWREEPSHSADQRVLFETELARVNQPSGSTLTGEHPAASAIFKLLPREILIRSEQRANIATIPESPDIVQLRLELTAGDAPSYRALIQTDESSDLAAVGGLTASRNGEGSVVGLNLPRKYMPAGNYQVRLYSEINAGRYVEVGLYPFRIVKSK